MSIKRNQYVICSEGDEDKRIFAEELQMTPSGDAAFFQLRNAAFVGQDGNRRFGMSVVPVLILAKGTFSSIRLVDANGREVCDETGAIDLIH